MTAEEIIQAHRSALDNALEVAGKIANTADKLAAHSRKLQEALNNEQERAEYYRNLWQEEKQARLRREKETHQHEN